MGLTLAADVWHEEKVKKEKLPLALRLKCERCCHEHKGTFTPPGVVWFWGGALLSLSHDWGIWGPLSAFCGQLCTTEQSLPTHSGTDSGLSSVDDPQACCKPKPLSLSRCGWAGYQESNQMLGAGWPGHNDQQTPSTKNGIVCSRGK